MILIHPARQLNKSIQETNDPVQPKWHVYLQKQKLTLFFTLCLELQMNPSSCRPETCYLYPLQGPKTALTGPGIYFLANTGPGMACWDVTNFSLETPTTHLLRYRFQCIILFREIL